MLPPSVVVAARPVVVPKWIPIAFGEIGIVEDVRPGRSLARIEQYHAATRAGLATDDVPWCASFVSWALEAAGVPSTRSKTAASYAAWGMPSPLAFGAVVLFPKTDRDAVSSGHVAFLLGAAGTDLYVLGGNQNNRVSIAVRKRTGALVRWPLSVQIPVT